MKEYLCPEENIRICGEAVTDTFFKEYAKYELGSAQKVILWAPTFRQSDYCGYNDSTEELLPMFKPGDYQELNRILKQYDFKLIVKLHPGQSLNKYSSLKLSNLEMYSDVEFSEKGWDLYQMLPQIDFLLTDYSSIFLQYLLIDRPMAFVVPDFEEYKERRGFVFKNPQEYMPGPIIKTKQELYDCLEQWNHCIDEFGEERRRVCNLIHKYKDGKNAQRAVALSGMKQR